MPAFPALWFTRFYLALLLAFGSELVLWPQPINITLAQAILSALAYLLLATALLDLLERYRVHELFGLLSVAGLYGLGNMVLLQGENPLLNLPYQFTSEALGGQTLVGLGALALFLLNERIHSRPRVWAVIMIVMGFIWGLRAQETFPNFATLIITVGIGLAAILGGWRLALRYGSHSAEALRLSRWEWALVILIGIGIVFTRGQGFTPFGGILIAVFSAYLLLILQVQRRRKVTPLLIQSLPFSSTKSRLWLWMTLCLFGGVILGYSLATQMSIPALELEQLILALCLAFGLSWLPAISLVMGIRNLQRQSHRWG